MILARQMTGSSLHRLAGLFHRDHSVICYAMRMNKPEVNEIVEKVRAELDAR
jgi:chromosomal replication initiation ATPase DnaA